MSLSACGRLALRTARHSECAVAEIPTFLCPGLVRSLQSSRISFNRPRRNTRTQRRFIQSQAQPLSEAVTTASLTAKVQLPTHCAGCGALTQATFKDDAGYFTVTRRSVKEYLGATSVNAHAAEDEVVKKALENVDSTILETLGMETPVKRATTKEPPVCDRCHNLMHHDAGVSIHHPSIRALQQTIYDSPYKYNHIYHVIDAADFPMSFVPALSKILNTTPQRSRNRRSRGEKFYGGKKTEIDFVITRSDLLAPKKEHVDKMMPYLTSVLRDALGRSGKDVRLGNVRCVSPVRGWWTSDLKEDIFKRGGGNWMVGKVNVGKSRLFREVFPKGRGAKVVVGKPLLTDEDMIEEDVSKAPSSTTLYSPIVVESEEEERELEKDGEGEWEETEIPDTMSLLPPAQPETDYPSMPLVSPLPGTTASPIRVPFGNGKGELIDLPGLSRGDLELHVQPEHRQSLVMRSRVKPEQKVIKPGQSFVLGGFIRITPTSPDIIVLAYNFTTMQHHVTSTEKAIALQTRTRESFIQNISIPGTEEKIASVGEFPLEWDVTKERTGPITNKSAVGLTVDELPYRVLSTDILIEGCGWVELVVQVSKRRYPIEPNVETWGEAEAKKEPWPSVEVFTPEGKFIAARRPMNAWVSFVEKKVTTARPRQSMKGAKKARKFQERAEEKRRRDAAL